MKEENYLEGIYGCLERIEKKVETLPVEGTSPAVGNRTSSPEGIAELKIRLERLQSAVEKNGLEIAAVRNHTVRLSEGWPLSAETFAGEMEKIRYCLSQDCQAVKETVRRLDERMVLLKKEPELLKKLTKEKGTGAQTGDLPSGKRIQGSGNDSFSTDPGTDHFRLDQLQPVPHEPAFERCRFEIPSHQDLPAGG